MEVSAAAGLIQVDAGAGQVLPTPAFDAWLAQPLAQQWLVLVDGWRAAAIELLPASVEGADGWPTVALGSRPPAPTTGAPARIRRDALLRQLRNVGTGSEADPAALIDAAAW